MQKIVYLLRHPNDNLSIYGLKLHKRLTRQFKSYGFKIVDINENDALDKVDNIKNDTDSKDKARFILFIPSNAVFYYEFPEFLFNFLSNKKTGKNYRFILNLNSLDPKVNDDFPVTIWGIYNADGNESYEFFNYKNIDKEAIIPEFHYYVTLAQIINSKKDILQTKKALLNSLKMPSDSLIGRYLFRPISINITRMLSLTPATPFLLTLFNFFVGVLAVAFIAFGDYWIGMIGGIIFLFGSILDGCDGELARLKCVPSEFGKYFDEIRDEVIHFFLILAIGYGYMQELSMHTYLVVSITIIYLFTIISQHLILWKMDKKISRRVFHYFTNPKTPVKRKNFFSHYMLSIMRWLTEIVRNDMLAFFTAISGILEIYHYYFWVIGIVVLGMYILTIVKGINSLRSTLKMK